MPLTDADRARLAKEWRIDPDTIPEPRRIETGVSGIAQVKGWKDHRNARFRMMVRGNRLLAADIRSGRRLPPQDASMPHDQPGVLFAAEGAQGGGWE